MNQSSEDGIIMLKIVCMLILVSIVSISYAEATKQECSNNCVEELKKCGGEKTNREFLRSHYDKNDSINLKSTNIDNLANAYMDGCRKTFTTCVRNCK